MAIHEITHPLIQHKIGLMREASISSKDFRELAGEVGNLLAYEATRHLPVELVDIKGWTGESLKVKSIKGKKITVSPIPILFCTAKIFIFLIIFTKFFFYISFIYGRN